MPDKPFTPDTVTDFLHTFELGIHSGVAAELLPPNQLAFAINCTVRGTFVTHRPALRKMSLVFPVPNQANFEGGLFQCCGYYQPDPGGPGITTPCLMASISGHMWLLTFLPGGSLQVLDVTAAGCAQDATATQEWMWQAEKWMIWNDGINPPVFWDGFLTVRSGFGGLTNRNATLNAGMPIPPIGTTATWTVSSTANMSANDTLQVQFLGWFTAINIVDAIHVDVRNDGGNPTVTGGWNTASVLNIFWQSTNNRELPPGRMGAYVMGRNWIAMPDGRQFIASDLLGGSSGTQGNNYRDAVRFITENAQLAYGGTFAVPGSIGDIRAIVGAATLDVSMGQGPVQIITPFAIFTCAASPDRGTWQTTNNPILTQAIITYGGLGQPSSIVVNGDTFYRSPDGWRSLVIGRRDFFSWGNTPLSYEVDRVLNQDNLELLQFAGAIVFDNRFLGTANPIQVANHGTYHLALVSLNFDPISAMGKKAPSVWEGMWTGLNVLQMVKGIFGGVERMFAFTLNILSNKIELYEFLKSGEANFDNLDGNDIPIIWEFETSKMLRDADPKVRHFKRLLDGELMVDQLVGTVEFQVFYRPDDYPCWVLWHSWTECATESSTQPQFRPRMGFGEPTSRNCDPSTNRPLREGYDYQLKFVIRGHCRVTGIRVKAVVIPDPTFAKPQCNPCPT